MTQFCKKSNFGSRSPGVILLMLLGMVAILSVLTLAFLDTVQVKLATLRTLKPPESMRHEAYSLLSIALAGIAEIHEIEGTLNSAQQPWGDPIAYAGIELPADLRYQITVRDESGKLPLGITDKRILVAFFESLDIPQASADTLADVWLDWMDADNDARFNGAESLAYRDLGYQPLNAVPQSLDSLKLLLGFDEWFWDENGVANERFAALRATFSPYHSGAVNINSLSAPLKAMLEQHYNLSSEVLEPTSFSTGNPWLTAEELSGVLGGAAVEGLTLSAEARTLFLQLTVERGAQVFSIECMLTNGQDIAQSGNSGNRSGFRVLALRENGSLL